MMILFNFRRFETLNMRNELVIKTDHVLHKHIDAVITDEKMQEEPRLYFVRWFHYQ